MFNSAWYNELIKPFLNPPNWIFPPVWSILYLTMFFALAIYIVKEADFEKTKGYAYFIIQLFLNGLWSPTFFYFRNMKLAVIIIILLDIFVILNIKEFGKVSKFAGLILIPYLIWILFATYLNFEYIRLN